MQTLNEQKVYSETVSQDKKSGYNRSSIFFTRTRCKEFELLWCWEQPTASLLWSSSHYSAIRFAAHCVLCNKILYKETYLPMSKGKVILFKSIHTIINFWRPLTILVVLPFHGDGNCMNLCQYSVLAFAIPKFYLCLGCGQILCRYSQSLAKTAIALWWVLLLQILCQSLPPSR